MENGIILSLSPHRRNDDLCDTSSCSALITNSAQSTPFHHVYQVRWAVNSFKSCLIGAYNVADYILILQNGM